MYCHKCGKENADTSKFCRFCGTKISSKTSEENTQKSKNKDENTSKTTKSQTPSIWEKFVEIYDSEGDEKNKFDSLSSAYISELIERLSTNAFESFIQENKLELNKQPYKTIEVLKKIFSWSVWGGYRLWMAEALLDKNEELNGFKSFNIDKFVDAWKVYDFDKATKSLSDEMGICLSRYADIRLNNLMENSPDAENISNETIEKLKSSLVIQALNGFHAGAIENTFRR